MFQLPQNEIYVDSRNWKTCLLLYALRDAYKSVVYKPPLANKMLKNNSKKCILIASWGHLSILKGFLYNCGHAGISCKQI